MANLDKKKSPQPGKIKLKISGNNAVVASDSDASGDTNSLSAESATEQAQPALTSRKKQRRRSSEWEIMEGLKDGQRFDNKPEPFNGFLHKKRKWPLKGWHKRYFVLDKGILIYGKGPSDINRGKVHGSVDIGLSVISSKLKRRRIDIDAEEFIYHLKAKTEDTFNTWVKQLTVHRLYRQHILTYGAKVGLVSHPTECDTTPEILSRDGSLTRGLKPIAVSGSRLNNWLLDSGAPLEKAQHDAAFIEKNINKLNQILQQIEIFHITSAGIGDSESLGDGLSPNIKKDRRKFGLKKKKSSKGGSVDLTMTFSKAAANETENTSPLSNNSSTGLSSSPQCVANSNSFGSSGNASTLPVPCISQSLPTSDNISCNLDMQIGATDYTLKEEFVSSAKAVVKDLKNLLQSVKIERDRLKAALDAEKKAGASISHNQTCNSLELSLNHALQQNSELRKRLQRIYEASDVSDLSIIDPNTETQRQFHVSLSYSSSCASEFFDAEELPVDKQNHHHQHHQHKVVGAEEEETLHLEEIDPDIRTHASDSSSEAGSLSSGEGSLSSESELGTEFTSVNNFISSEGGPTQGLTGRRTTLPAPRPDTEGLSLWNLLCKNIGKDLSQISMPVALNEPLNMLQRLCEELEYSELLDKASELDDPYERMVHIAAFAVSSYASSYSRAGNKPFNPLLGETYECVREDKGFRFIAEQVSHHPPISACYADSKNYTFWQEARIKTKFWGKSMEFQPLGQVHVLLARTGDLYSWNKVTTCVHNLFSSQRWVDQYGELRVSNGPISCKLTFAKASYWSAKRHEVVGAVYDESGKVVKQLFGKWSEALYCGVAPAARCIWRAGTMPPDHQRYYGFTRFAMELNELGPDSHLLPPTDTRLRPDQRALEHGDINAAEQLKLQLENAQRDRRKQREELSVQHEPKWFTNRKEFNEDIWQYNGKYWEMKRNPGFSNMQFEVLW